MSQLKRAMDLYSNQQVQLANDERDQKLKEIDDYVRVELKDFIEKGKTLKTLPESGASEAEIKAIWVSTEYIMEQLLEILDK